MIALLLALAAAAAAVAPAPTKPPRGQGSPERPALGLAVNLPSTASPAERQKALEEVRHAGVSLFALDVSWSAAEPRPRRYDVGDVTRTARLLRQSGAVLHLDLPLVNGPSRLLPPDLVSLAFDDPKLGARLGGLLEALGPALADFATLSLGNQADSYFATRPDEIRAFVRLLKGAVDFLAKAAPRLRVGVSTAVPMDSPFPAAVTALHQNGRASFYLYAPFVKGTPFTHRPPATLDSDWRAILAAAGGSPVAFTEVSFSSAAENGSSPRRQAEFVRRMRRFLDGADGARLLFARYVPWRDPEAGPLDRRTLPPLPRGKGAGGEGADREAALTSFQLRRSAFLANRGLAAADGRPKPAWKEFQGPNPR
jgi:hypothetical protein